MTNVLGFRWISLIVVIVLLFGFVTAQSEEATVLEVETEAAEPGKVGIINNTAKKAPETDSTGTRRLIYSPIARPLGRRCPAGQRRNSNGLCRVVFTFEEGPADQAAEV